jgi:hypothetical protein
MIKSHRKKLGKGEKKPKLKNGLKEIKIDNFIMKIFNLWKTQIGNMI